MKRVYLLSAWVFAAVAASGCIATEPQDLTDSPEVVEAKSCTINLLNGSSNCDDIEGVRVTLDRVAGSTSLTDPCYQSRVDVDLSPGGKRVRFGVTYGASASDWTVNIGDSPTNDGFSGDGGTQSRDAEMQIRGNQMVVYTNDHTPSGTDKALQILNGLDLSNRYIELLVSDQRLDWTNLSPYSSGYVFSPYLFALDGQSDSEGAKNYKIHAGFNRVIAGSYRYGCGVTNTQVTVETLGSPPPPPPPGGGGGCLLPQC